MLTLEVVTPIKRVLPATKVRSVTVPGALGEMTILPGHAKLVSILETGVVAFETETGTRQVAAISSGFVEVKDDGVVVLAETLEMAKDIDLERAKRAQSKAEQRLAEKEIDPDQFRKYQLKLQRSLIRQQAAGMLTNN
jgi:F-type H+-transporting ATPase subunit epsilon